MLNNKKGISAVVATVLIILITVAAVTIVWVTVMPMIKDQTTGGTVCLDAVSQLSIVTDGGYTCWNFTSNKTNIQVGRGAGNFELSEIKVILSEAGSSTSIPVKMNTTLNLSANEKKLISVSYKNTTVAGPEKVEISPVVKVGNTDKSCDIAAAVSISKCA